MTATATPLPPRAEPAVTLQQARDEFARLRRRARTGILVEALGILAALLVAYALPTLVVDRGLRLEWPFRAGLLASFVFVVANGARRRLLQPLAVRLDDDEMALAVERREPGLRQALISSLQFGHLLARGEPVIESRALMAATVDDVQARLHNLPFAAAIDRRRVRRYGALGAAGALVFVGWGLLDAESLGIWARRNLALASVEWPVYTWLEFLGATGPVVPVPQGDPYTVRVGVTGVVPDQVFLNYKFAGGEDGVEMMSRTGEGEFTLTLDAVLEDCELWAEGGDGHSAPLRITTVERPRIEDLAVTVRFPDYMQKPPETLPPTEGEVRLVRGSELLLAGRSHKRVREAYALLGDQKQLLDVAADRQAFGGSVVPKTGALLEINVIDEDTLVAGAPPRLLIRIVEDKPPSLDLKLRGISSLITMQARIPGDLKVKDDFGIMLVRAGVRVIDDQAGLIAPKDPGGAPAPEVPFEPVQVVYGDSLQPASVRYETSASVDLKQLNSKPEQEDAPENKVRPGMLLSLRYEAVDNFGPGEPHVSQGEALTFRVVTREKLLEELRRRQVEQRQEAERIRDEERLASMELKETVNPAAPDPRSQQAKSRFKALARQQQALGRRVTFVADVYQRILWEFENNRVMDPAKVREMEGLITVPLQSLGREPFPATARQVDDFAASGEESIRTAALEGYAEILVRLEAIIKVMEQAETLAALLEQLKGVIKTQDNAIQEVERRLREAGENVFGPGRKETGKNPDEKKPDEKR